MAQYNTGLGWEAKDNWLMEGTGNFAYIPGGYYWDIPGFTQQEVPVCAPTSADVVNSGLLFYDRTINRARYRGYLAANKPGVVTAYFYTDNPEVYKQIIFIPDATYQVYYQQVENDSYQGNLAIYTNPNTVLIGTKTVYYYYRQGNGRAPDAGWLLTIPSYPYYSTLDACATAAYQDVVESSQIDFAKVNTGFAVACTAKWYTQNNVLITTPVLISSDSSYTDMTSTDSSFNLAKLRTRMDGITFYMSYFDIVNKGVTGLVNDVDMTGVLPYVTLDRAFELIADPAEAYINVVDTVDPYEDFPYNEEDAGEINPDPEDDDVDFDDLPTKSFATAGFCRIFNPDVSDLNDLASYMWTDQNFLQTVINHLKQILENPIEAIISLSMVPVQPPVGPSKVPVNVMFINTGVSMRPVTSQFVTVDCGTTVLQECYGGALDYNPYTRVQIYLPYIGTVQLDTDEVMAKTLHLQYHIDVVTGICCAEIKADNKLLYSFSGHCAVSQPITSADFSSYLNAAIAAAKVAVGVATGMASTTAGAAAAEVPPAAPSKAQTSSALVPLQSSGAIGPHLGSPGMAGSRGRIDFSDIPEPQAAGGISWGELARPGNANTVASAMGGKMVVQHSGGFSGNSGYLAKRRPYLIVIRPRIANPRNYAQHFGRTSMEYLNLGSCTGYTKVQSVHLSGFDATNPELSEISSLLKGGVLM